MRLGSLSVSDELRRNIGKSFAAASVCCSAFGLVVLAALWGWDPLVRTDAIYFGVLGLGFGTLTWILVDAQADNGAVWAVAWSALFASLFTAGLASALLLSRQSFPGLTLDQLRELSPAMLPRPAALALHFRFWAVVPALWIALTFGLLLFPDGHLPSRGWRWVGRLSALAITTATLASAAVHNPWSSLPVKAAEDTVDSFGGALIDLSFLLSSVAALLSTVSLVHRYRSATGTARGQIRWIGFGGVIFTLTLIVGGNLDESSGTTLLSDLLGVLAFMVLVVCWGVAIMKYRLYDIDVIVSKSVTYLGLGAIITGLYVLVVLGPLLVVGRSDDGGPGLVLPILATGAVAIVFEPVRVRMQRLANRLVYGDRASPHEVLSQVTARLADRGAGAGTDDLARLLAKGTGADRAVVWLVAGEVLVPDGVWQRADSDVVAPVPIDGLANDEFTMSSLIVHRDEVFGAVSIEKPKTDPVTAGDRELVADVAAGSALLLRNITLNRQLEERASEVRESRRRLIAAQDAERHRLERDLHDGAQQQVVALKVKLGIAKTLADREGAEKIAERVLVLAEQTQSAVDALRAVAHGIYPPLLESEGLAAALRAVERNSAIPVELGTVGLGRYARSIEETAYFCVLETIERARMSGATSARVEVAGRNGDLITEIDVTDARTHMDLTAVADRLDAAGGFVTVEEKSSGRTQITSTLPVIDFEPATA